MTLTHIRTSAVALPGTIVELTCERLRRYEGSWHTEKVALFPEHIVIESNDQYVLEDYLHNSNANLNSISPTNEYLLRQLCGPEGFLRMSRGVIHGGITCVTEGPLKGKEAIIRKIDRHKRLATLTLPDPEDHLSLRVGLEIVEKTLEE